MRRFFGMSLAHTPGDGQNQMKGDGKGGAAKPLILLADGIRWERTTSGGLSCKTSIRRFDSDRRLSVGCEERTVRLNLPVSVLGALLQLLPASAGAQMLSQDQRIRVT